MWHATDQRREVQFYAIDFNRDPRLYCGVGAILNRHFVHTLHYLYNADHEDHYHIDTSISPGFSIGSKSRALFLQATLHHVHDLPVVIDGDVGSRTLAAVDTVLRRLEISRQPEHPDGVAGVPAGHGADRLLGERPGRRHRRPRPAWTTRRLRPTSTRRRTTSGHPASRSERPSSSWHDRG